MSLTKQAHYLRLYKKADEILSRPDNPCQIKAEGNEVTCVVTRSGRSGRSFAPPNTLCCTGCEHLGPQGCKVQALGCKLGWCFCTHSTIEGMHVQDHPAFLEIKALRDEAFDLRLPMRFRRSFEENFDLSH